MASATYRVLTMRAMMQRDQLFKYMQNEKTAVKTGKATIIGTGKLVRLIAIGNRGTAFAMLDEAQLAKVKMDGDNAIFAKTDRTATQLRARDNGQHQGALWADSCSWVQSREAGDTFKLFKLETALSKKLVRKARVTITQGKAEKVLTGYVRANFDASQALSKAHKVIACDGVTGGRIEASEVRRENGKGLRNKQFIASVEKVELV